MRVNSNIVAEKSSALLGTTLSMAMEMKAITEALIILRNEDYIRAFIVPDSRITLETIRKQRFYSDWVTSLTGVIVRKLLESSVPDIQVFRVMKDQTTLLAMQLENKILFSIHQLSSLLRNIV